MLAPQAGLQNKLSVSRLISFVDSGRNLFVASAPAYSAYTEKLVEAIGVDLDDRSNVVLDYQNTVDTLSDTSNTFIRAANWAHHAFNPSDPDSASSASARDLVYSGPGATLFKDNELVHPLLWASASSFGRARSSTAGKPLTAIPRVAGTGAVLAAGVCTLHQSRAAWFGSLDALSNAVFKKAGVAHTRATKHLLQWAAGDSGVLRVVRVAHGRIADGGATAREGGAADYRVKDVIEFLMEVQVWDGEAAQWKGFEANDIQVEFVMMDPWVRARMHMVNGSAGVYKAQIQVPDQIGVYKFKVEYVRPGLSVVKVEKVVAVRPFLHNEYERFIPMASPYYVASFSMMIGVFLLGMVVLCGNDEDAWAAQMKTGRWKVE